MSTYFTHSTKYKGYDLHHKNDNGNTITTIVKDGVIVSMAYSSPLDKNNSERKAQIKIDNNFAKDHKSLMAELS